MAAILVPLRAAIVGTGYIGAARATALRRAGAEVTWIIGRPSSNVAGWAAALRVPRATEHVADVLADRTVDVVHVCTLHYPMARAVVAQDKHLIAALRAAIARVQAGGMPAGDDPTLADRCRSVALVEATLDSARAMLGGDLAS